MLRRGWHSTSPSLSTLYLSFSLRPVSTWPMAREKPAASAQCSLPYIWQGRKERAHACRADPGAERNLSGLADVNASALDPPAGTRVEVVLMMLVFLTSDQVQHREGKGARAGLTVKYACLFKLPRRNPNLEQIASPRGGHPTLAETQTSSFGLFMASGSFL